MPEHICFDCGTPFSHDICNHPDASNGVELLCDYCVPEAFTWTSDETGMEDEEY